MKLSLNQMSIAANYAYKANLANTAKSAMRLSSGKRINSAADDPSGLAMSSRMKSTISGQKTAIQNISDDLSLLNTQYSGLRSAQDTLLRMRDLAVRAANDATLTSKDYSTLSKEMSSLTEHIYSTAKGTLFNGREVLIGIDSGLTSSDLEFELEWWRATDIDMHVIQPDGAHAWYADQDPNGHGTIDVDDVDGSNGITPALEHYNVASGAALTGNYDLWINFYSDGTGTGANETVTVTVSMYRGTSSETIQTFDVSVPYQFGNAPYNSMAHNPPFGELFVGSYFWAPLVGSPKPTMFLGAGDNPAIDLYDDHTFYETRPSGLGISAVSVASGDAARSAIDSIDAALDEVADNIVEVGKHADRLQSALEGLHSSNINMSSANSNIEDTDFAQEATAMTASMILSDFTAWAKMNADKLSEAVMTLIQQHTNNMG